MITYQVYKVGTQWLLSESGMKEWKAGDPDEGRGLELTAEPGVRKLKGLQWKTEELERSLSELETSVQRQW